MQFITTRNSDKLYSLEDVCQMDVAPDGGYFIPTKLPVCSPSMLQADSFTGTMAKVLNLFLGTELTAWDVDFCIGRGVLRLVSMNHKIAVAELWHNLERNSSYITEQLHKKLVSEKESPTLWFCVFIRIAIWFGVYAQMRQMDILQPCQNIDVSVMENDHSGILSAVYARDMGLPIGNVILTCAENSPVWDIVHRGSCNLTSMESASSILIEWLTYTALGAYGTSAYRDLASKHLTYTIPEELMAQFSAGLFCAVPGVSRAMDVINSVYRANGYILDSNTALRYGALQDYRARSGASCVTLLAAENSPMESVDTISKAIGISENAILKIVNPS